MYYNYYIIQCAPLNFAIFAIESLAFNRHYVHDIEQSGSVVDIEDIMPPDYEIVIMHS